MDFGGSSQQQNQTSTPTLPPMAGRSMGDALRQLAAALGGGIPNLTQFFQNFPLQGVSPLNAGQQFDISQFQNQAGDPFGLNPQEQAAQQAYSQMATGQ